MGYVFLSNRIDKNTYPFSGKGPIYSKPYPKPTLVNKSNRLRR